MSGEPPGGTTGLRHVALRVAEFEACVEFYTDVMGMSVEWRPDRERIFLTSGDDNLALHRASVSPAGQGQRLDHVGFVIDDIDDVDRWHEHLLAAGVIVQGAPKPHADGARSFFCRDPDGTRVQILYHPPLSRE